ncbi:MAG: ABC transporter ATP-binding protein [Burkholderiaceae bacterium]
MTTPYLEISDLHAWYGESLVLHGINLSVAKGEIVCLLGRNGAGRTTTLRAILGLTGQRKGAIKINGRDVIGIPTHEVAKLGIGYCPEERGIFTSLTCEQNLLLPPKVGDGKGLELSEIYEMFPNLLERRNSPGGRLSGGEQQMLAIARILRTGADLLLLDEITEGLAPVIVQKLDEVVRTLRERGFTVVLVEQNFRFASKLADRNYVIEHGQVVKVVKNEELEQNKDELVELLGV